MNAADIVIELFDANKSMLNLSYTWYCPLNNDIAQFRKLILGHILGRQRVALFPRHEDGTTSYVVIEFEEHGDLGISDAFKAAASFKHLLEFHDIPSYLERSKSLINESYHLYLFLEEAVPAFGVVAVIETAVRQILGIRTEVFPKLRHANGGSVFLPLFRGRDYLGGGIKQKRTVFIDANRQAVPDQYGYLNRVKYVAVRDIKEFAEVNGIKFPNQDTNKAQITHDYSKEPLGKGIERLFTCEFINYWSENQDENMTEKLWDCGISNLCRFEGGEDFIHKISSTYSHPVHRYSKNATQRKIDKLRSFSPPFTCKTIQKSGFTCKKIKECGMNGINAPASWAYR